MTALRLLRLARHFHGGVLLTQALMRSASAMVVPVYLLAVIVMFFGGLIFACESGGLVDVDASGGVPVSLPDAVWLTFITMTTVGYGDLSPTSSLGKLVTMFSTLMGIIFVAMPLTIVGDNFSEAWQNRKLQFILDQIRDQLHVRSVQDCVVAFETFDATQDGWIDWVKFKAGVRKSLKLNVRVSQLFSVWEQIDKGSLGSITLLDWCELFFPDDEQQISALMQSLLAARAAAKKKGPNANTPGSSEAPPRLAHLAPSLTRLPSIIEASAFSSRRQSASGESSPQSRHASSSDGESAHQTEDGPVKSSPAAIEARLAVLEDSIERMSALLWRSLEQPAAAAPIVTIDEGAGSDVCGDALAPLSVAAGRTSVSDATDSAAGFERDPALSMTRHELVGKI